eukprot:1320134-Amorphochlora_amoeboformis.AAC.2
MERYISRVEVGVLVVPYSRHEASSNPVRGGEDDRSRQQMPPPELCGQRHHETPLVSSGLCSLLITLRIRGRFEGPDDVYLGAI